MSESCSILCFIHGFAVESMISLKIGGIIVAAFIAGAFVASPELRAYAANTIGSADIIDGQVKTADLGGNSVTAAKIKDGEVKAAEIGIDAVGAEELMGVDKLIFASCDISFPNIAAGTSATTTCSVPGVAAGDHVVVTFDADSTSTGRHCFAQTSAFASATDQVLVRFKNVCTVTVNTSSFTAAIIVYST